MTTAPGQRENIEILVGWFLGVIFWLIVSETTGRISNDEQMEQLLVIFLGFYNAGAKFRIVPGYFQFLKRSKDDNLLWLPTDAALHEDPKFKVDGDQNDNDTKMNASILFADLELHMS